MAGGISRAKIYLYRILHYAIAFEYVCTKHLVRTLSNFPVWVSVPFQNAKSAYCKTPNIRKSRIPNPIYMWINANLFHVASKQTRGSAERKDNGCRPVPLFARWRWWRQHSRHLNRGWLSPNTRTLPFLLFPQSVFQVKLQLIDFHLKPFKL